MKNKSNKITYIRNKTATKKCLFLLVVGAFLVPFFCLAKEKDVNKQADSNMNNGNMQLSIQALGILKTKTERGNWRISWNKDSGVPRIVSGGKTIPYGKVPEAAANAFLKNHQNMLIPRKAKAIGESKVTLEIQEIKKTKGGNRVVYQQKYLDIPIYRSFITLMLDSDGRVFHIANTAIPQIDIETVPSKTIEDVLIKLKKDIGVMDITIKEHNLVIYPSVTSKLAYQIICFIGAKKDLWEYVLDANEGHILRETRLVKEISEKEQNTTQLLSDKKNVTPQTKSKISVLVTKSEKTEGKIQKEKQNSYQNTTNNSSAKRLFLPPSPINMNIREE